MKKIQILSLLCFTFMTIGVNAQQEYTGNIGIDINSPDSNLDINGDLRVRKIEKPQSFKNVLSLSSENVVNKTFTNGKLVYDGTFDNYTAGEPSDWNKTDTEKKFADNYFFLVQTREKGSTGAYKRTHVIEETGLYRINTNMVVQVTPEVNKMTYSNPRDSSDQTSLSRTNSNQYGVVKSRIIIGFKKEDGSNKIYGDIIKTKNIYRGSVTTNPNPFNYDNVLYNINNGTTLFLTKDSIVAVNMQVFGIKSIVEETKPENLKIRGDLSEIKIIKLL